MKATVSAQKSLQGLRLRRINLLEGTEELCFLNDVSLTCPNQLFFAYGAPLTNIARGLPLLAVSNFSSFQKILLLLRK